TASLRTLPDRVPRALAPIARTSGCGQLPRPRESASPRRLALPRTEASSGEHDPVPLLLDAPTDQPSLLHSEPLGHQDPPPTVVQFGLFSLADFEFQLLHLSQRGNSCGPRRREALR